MSPPCRRLRRSTVRSLITYRPAAGAGRLTIAIYTLVPSAHAAIDRPSGASGGPLVFVRDPIWLVLGGMVVGARSPWAFGLAVTIIAIAFA